MNKLTLKLSLILLTLMLAVTGVGLELMPADGFFCTSQQLETIRTVPPFSVDVESADGVDTLNYKLFDILTLKSVKANVLAENYVYLGGYPVGITVRAEGVIVAGVGSVVTSDGLIYPLGDTDIRIGDVLISVDGAEVHDAGDIADALKDAKSTVDIVIRRGEDTVSYTVTPAADVLSGNRKLGLSIKEDISGIGTLTYVTDDGKFGALGHKIADSETGLSGDAISDGKLFNANIFGVVKGKKGVAGELKGSFNMFDKGVGVIDKNNSFGVFGTTTIDVNDFTAIEVGGASEVKPGKAYIYATVDGKTPDMYEIQIVKASLQDAPKEKSMVISVTDKRLLGITGGIVQGMSGSPIVQNGKLVGAVTHVFVNEPTKGYGVYIGWML